MLNHLQILKPIAPIFVDIFAHIVWQGGGLLRRCVLAIMLALASVFVAQAKDVPVVASASSLQFALTVLSEQFTAHSGERIRIVLGSSGNLYQQIRKQAPFALFLSADTAYPAALQSQGITTHAPQTFARGGLVLFCDERSPLAPTADGATLRRLLAEQAITRFAIANPDHAPYGERAKQWLQQQQLWQGLAPRLVIGENVAQTAQFALTGAVQGAIIAQSMVQGGALQGRGHYRVLDTQHYAPLLHSMVLLPKAGAVAKRFADFVLSAQGQEILANHGFQPAP